MLLHCTGRHRLLLAPHAVVVVVVFYLGLRHKIIIRQQPFHWLSSSHWWLQVGQRCIALLYGLHSCAIIKGQGDHPTDSPRQRQNFSQSSSHVIIFLRYNKNTTTTDRAHLVHCSHTREGTFRNYYYYCCFFHRPPSGQPIPTDWVVLLFVARKAEVAKLI